MVQSAHKRAAEERKGWRYSGMMSEEDYSRRLKKKNWLVQGRKYTVNKLRQVKCTFLLNVYNFRRIIT